MKFFMVFHIVISSLCAFVMCFCLLLCCCACFSLWSSYYVFLVRVWRCYHWWWLRAWSSCCILCSKRTYSIDLSWTLWKWPFSTFVLHARSSCVLEIESKTTSHVDVEVLGLGGNVLWESCKVSLAAIVLTTITLLFWYNLHETIIHRYRSIYPASVKL